MDEFTWKLPGPATGPEYRQGFAAAREQADVEFDRLREIITKLQTTQDPRSTRPM
jgi:hypothetical protein